MKFLCPSIFYILDVFRYHLIDLLSDLEQGSRRFGASIKADLLAKDVLDLFYHALAAAERFGKAERAHILQSLIKGENANRFESRSVLCGVDRKSIPSGEGVSCAGIEIGIDRVFRVHIIIKIISPMQKSLDAVFIHLHAYHTRSCRRHRKKSVRQIDAL